MGCNEGLLLKRDFENHKAHIESKVEDNKKDTVKKIEEVEESSKMWWRNINKTMDKSMGELKNTINEMPEKIVKRINENVDIKIDSKIKDSESKLFKWIAGLAIGFAVQLVVVVVAFVLTKG